MEILILAAIIAAALALFLTRLVPLELTALGIIAALALTGILEPAEALQGFSSPATVTVASMFVLSAALTRTGMLDLLQPALARARGLGPRGLLVAFALVAGVASAFMNNTPVVVLLIPIVLSLCRNSAISPSRLFIPISYFAILGGTCTLIGTSTNILIDDLSRKSGGPGFGLFDFTPFGVVYFAVGAITIIALAPLLLPERTPLSALMPARRSASFVTEVVIQAASPWIGRRLEDSLPRNGELQLLELIRGEEIIPAVRARALPLAPDDALIIQGSPNEISRFLSSAAGVELASVVEDEQRVPMRTIQLRLIEAVVLPDSRFLGRPVMELGLHRLYGVKVVAVQRGGRQHRYRIRRMKLMEGDVLLLQVDDRGAAALREGNDVLIVEGVEETIHRHRRLPLAVAIMACMVLATALLHVPLAVAALSAAILVLFTRCLRVDEAFRALDTTTLMMLAGTIPLGIAMSKTGLAQAVVRATVGLLDPSRPWLLLSVLYIVTALLTEVLSNNASAVLLTPIVVRLGADLGVDPRPLLLAVAFGASASFNLPIGYQTNLIVMGPGGYRFSDYARLGIPLSIVLWLTATLVIPLFWPLRPL
ncbi:MAG: SLC13 family permease [Candidatus Eisenbacteria bacterium]|uniref:SLC13 family permease n=1 Tax=Eiseniibacteriota bacterium TaxID=2212470 RepID=A0A937XB76_UNCEI|nr:SLC13 family permease [Candidatus Eisenbacteria bacterium]